MARLTGESKTEAVRQALVERHQRLMYRLSLGDKGDRIADFLVREVWSQVPSDELGRRLSRESEDEILGYGEPGS